MSKLSKTNRILAAIALAGVTASILAPQSAEAFGGRGGGRGFGGGGVHAGGGHSGGGHFGGSHFGGNHSFGHRDPGRHVADRNPNWTRHPGRVPPIRIKLPPRKWPPIWIPGRHRLPPVIVRVPPRFVPPVIIARPRIPVVPVVVGGGPVVRPVAAMPTPVARAACINDGSFITIVFVPTVTAADITAFLNTYDVTMADGPNRDGIYRIRLSAKVLPQNDVLKIIEAMRAQTQIVASIEGA